MLTSDSNSYYDDLFDFIPNNCSESESDITSERNIPSFKNNNFSEFKSISNIFTNSIYMNVLSKPLTFISNEGKDCCNENKFNFIEQLNKKEDFFKSSDINSYEKLGENVNIVINYRSDYSNKNNENNSRPNDNNKISLISKKRKFSEENNKNKFSIFTPSEENNNCSSKNSNTISEQKGCNSLNKKEKTKKQKNIKKRKYDNDLIRKKIKKRFLKDLKNKVNKTLKSEGCRVQFKYFPPLFADNLSKDINNDFLDKTLKDLFSTDFIKFMEDRNIKNLKIEDTDKSNYEHNISVLNTLKRNPKKYKKKFNFFNVTYNELFNEYLKSKEFEIAIDELEKKEFKIAIDELKKEFKIAIDELKKKEFEIYIDELKKEVKEYIKKYIDEANNLMMYFKN